MRNIISILTIFFLVTTGIYAQKPKEPNAAEIYGSIQKLNFLGSVLYVAAHPDDENTRLISYMSNHEKARTAYLSLTRGDGGQNLIGPELRELLGVIRTQELLAARRIDGGEQRFTRANDFGYSKHPDETLSIWNKDEVLSDVVWAIRTFKPDIVINRFDHRTPGSTHGHHTSSAILSMEAFDLANNPTKFPEQLQYTQTWQPKRIFFNTSWWFYGSQEKFDKADKSKLLAFDIGVYYPLKGVSNNEIASLASSQHLCQGFGRLSQRGSDQEYIEFLKGDFPLDKNNLFSGIDTSWNRVKGGQAIGDILHKIEKNFNFANPSVHIPELIKAYQLVQNLEDEHWKSIKSDELLDIIQACAGLYLEASAEVASASPDSDVKINIEVVNRSSSNITLRSVAISPINSTVNPSQKLEYNTKYTYEITGHLPKDIDYSSPYWLKEKGSLGMYKVNDQKLIGLPETPSPVKASFILNFDGYSLPIEKDVIYRYSKPDKGELYKPFDIVPQASVKLDSKVYIFASDDSKTINITVKAGKDNLQGKVSLCHPEVWNVSPELQNVSIARKDETQTFTFSVQPPKNQQEGYITPMVTVGEDSFTNELIEIDYSHIPFQTVLMPCESKVVRLDIKKKGENIGYIVGAGDAVPESLQQIGYNVVTLNPDQLSAQNLEGLDAVVVGIRAYNVLENIESKQDVLFDFVSKGGNMIVQYNTDRGLKTNQLAPYKLELSRDRVTEENAEVKFLDPKNELLNVPNVITEKDFEGWTQERGLYFPDNWAREFTAVLSLHDSGESAKDGSLLVASYGKGHYIYTGLSFFRELPEGVSGAYRLFANMLSIGKETIQQQPKLQD